MGKRKINQTTYWPKSLRQQAITACGQAERLSPDSTASRWSPFGVLSSPDPRRGVTHLGRRAGVHGVFGWAQGRRFSLETAAVLGLAEFPEKHNRGPFKPGAQQADGWYFRSSRSAKSLSAGSNSYCLKVLSKRVLQELRASILGKIWEEESTTGKYQW